ncbi:MAG: lytic transglycosylase [Mesorhizobium amorphae]|nr:MAG: lytic transglycosylase [Mesorhizobium amorphae]
MASGRRTEAGGTGRVLPLLALLLAWTISSSDARATSATNACENEILRAAQRYSIPAGILYAVGLTETGVKGSLQPFALNIAGKAVFAKSRAEAVRLAEEAAARGVRLVDLGCMQINRRWHGQHFASLDAMLDPAANVDYAARFLSDLNRRHEGWTMAVARYHAGPDNDPAQARYVCRVIRNLVATGFGKWTPNAREFCHE